MLKRLFIILGFSVGLATLVAATLGWLLCMVERARFLRRAGYSVPEDARSLYARAPKPKELWLVPNAGHVDLHRAAPAQYEAHVLTILHEMDAEKRP